MSEIAFLQELQGGQSQQAFGALLGVSQAFISMVYSGERRLGRSSLEKLLAAYPLRRDEILRVFLRENHNECNTKTAFAIMQ